MVQILFSNLQEVVMLEQVLRVHKVLRAQEHKEQLVVRELMETPEHPALKELKV